MIYNDLKTQSKFAPLKTCFKKWFMTFYFQIPILILLIMQYELKKKCDLISVKQFSSIWSSSLSRSLLLWLASIQSTGNWSRSHQTWPRFGTYSIFPLCKTFAGTVQLAQHWPHHFAPDFHLVTAATLAVTTSHISFETHWSKWQF